MKNCNCVFNNAIQGVHIPHSLILHRTKGCYINNTHDMAITYRDGQSAFFDLINLVMRVRTIHSAPNRLGCPQDLLHCPRELPGHGAWPHGASDVYHLVHSDVPIVQD